MSFEVLTYFCPTKVYLGIGAHQKLPGILSGFGTKPVLFLCDPGVAVAEIFATVSKILKENNVIFEVFTDIDPEPKDKNVEKAFQLFQALNPGVILALGGGSTIDVGKALGILATNGGRIHDYQVQISSQSRPCRSSLSRQPQVPDPRSHTPV